MADMMADMMAAMLTALLRGLHALEFTARHLDPETLADVVAAVGTPDDDLRALLDTWLPEGDGQGVAASEMDGAAAVHRVLATSGAAVLAGFDGLRDAASRGDLRAAYQAARREAAALEALFPLVGVFPAVSDFFLESGSRQDTALRARLAAPRGGVQVGIMHAANDRGTRGGFSLLVPESYRPDVAHPLVVALHGGSGHGRAFLWNWARAARTRGLIVACPTSAGGTWALDGPDEDTPRIGAMLDFIRERWNIDAGRLLLTGMSDGGSFTLLTGLRAESPFTHLAPFAAGFHPLMVQMGDADRVRGLAVYIVHGARDWMFPVELARQSHQAFAALGARVTYREVDDLAHVYPRDENAALVDWLMATPA